MAYVCRTIGHEASAQFDVPVGRQTAPSCSVGAAAFTSEEIALLGTMAQNDVAIGASFCAPQWDGGGRPGGAVPGGHAVRGSWGRVGQAVCRAARGEGAAGRA